MKGTLLKDIEDENIKAIIEGYNAYCHFSGETKQSLSVKEYVYRMLDMMHEKISSELKEKIDTLLDQV